jgi:hypothetical protein
MFALSLVFRFVSRADDAANVRDLMHKSSVSDTAARSKLALTLNRGFASVTFSLTTISDR